MEIMNTQNIKFSNMRRTKYTNSTIYQNGDELIKTLDDYPKEDRDKLFKKFMEMDGISIEGLILPKALIMKDDTLYAYTMDNFKNSMNLEEYFTRKRYVNINEILEVFKKVSIILKKVHEAGIIFQDISLSNILIDEEGNVALCDVDSCSYKDNLSPYISANLKNLIDSKNLEYLVSENTDRVSLLLSLFYIIYLKDINALSKEEYQSVSNKVQSLKNMEKYFNSFTNSNEDIKEVPYPDEIINIGKGFRIDRVNQKR